MEPSEVSRIVGSAPLSNRQASESVAEGDCKAVVSHSAVTWNDGSLDFMFKDDFVLMHVEWKQGVIITCERYLDNPLGVYVCSPVTNLDDLDVFLESRCFPDSRDNALTLLADLGFENTSLYDPMEICRQTHGLQWDDFFWIRFPGDTVCYRDIQLRD